MPTGMRYGDKFGPRNMFDVLAGTFSSAGQNFGDVPTDIEERDYEREWNENERTHKRKQESIQLEMKREEHLANMWTLQQAFDIRGKEATQAQDLYPLEKREAVAGVDAAEFDVTREGTRFEQEELLYPHERTAADLANQLTQAQIKAVKEGRGKTGTKGLSPSEETRRQEKHEIMMRLDEERLERKGTKKELSMIRYDVSEEAVYKAFGTQGGSKEYSDAVENLNQRALAAIKADLQANAEWAGEMAGPVITWESLGLPDKRRMIKARIDEWLEQAGASRVNNLDIGLDL